MFKLLKSRWMFLFFLVGLLHLIFARKIKTASEVACPDWACASDILSRNPSKESQYTGVAILSSTTSTKCGLWIHFDGIDSKIRYCGFLEVDINTKNGSFPFLFYNTNSCRQRTKKVRTKSRFWREPQSFFKCAAVTNTQALQHLTRSN